MDTLAVNWRMHWQISRCARRIASFGGSRGSDTVRLGPPLVIIIDLGLMLFVVGGFPLPFPFWMLLFWCCCRCWCVRIATSNAVIAVTEADDDDPTCWSNLGRLLVPVIEENDDDDCCCCPVAVGNSSVAPRFVGCFFAPIVDEEIDPFIRTLFPFSDAIVVGPFPMEFGWKRLDGAGFARLFATAGSEHSLLSSELSSTKVSNN